MVGTTMRGVMSPTQFAATDFVALGQYKANLIRWQIMRNWGLANTERDLTNYNAWLAGKLNELDQVLIAAKAWGIKVVIDLHTPPGGRYADSSMAMFYEHVYNDRFIEIWKEIATRYRGNPTVWALDLINEPTINNATPLSGLGPRETQVAAAWAVRAIDSMVPILIEAPATFNSATAPDAYKQFVQITGIANIWYEVHIYNYLQSFVDHTACYPGPANGLTWNKDLLKAIISPARAFQLTYTVKMYVGEFSIPVGACGSTQFLSDLIDIFEEYGWDWTCQAFREAPMWSIEAPDRKALLLSWFAKNKPMM